MIKLIINSGLVDKTVRILIFCLSTLIFQYFGCSQEKLSEIKKIEVQGIKNPLIKLDGTWKFTKNPPVEFWKNASDPTNWNNIRVPGECGMQGFAIKHNTPYAYKTKIRIPRDYESKIIKLKFDGVYSYARIWINEKFIREHHGGFTAFECDITNYVKGGDEVWLTVEITDKKNDLSYGSGYAKHPVGGILRSVWLQALPQNYFKYINIDTDLDQKYQDGRLNITLETSLKQPSYVSFELYDNHGNRINIGSEKYPINGVKKIISFSINHPEKWDAEHPCLYTLKTKLVDQIGNITYSKTQPVGFREIEIVGNRLLVNGKPVKLRGACRHDIHPLLGRISTPEYDKKDVLLAKEANINFIRTSHYPPSESFLDYCDQYGIFVEDESAVCFVNTHRSPGYRELLQSGPEFTHQYLSQLEEMVFYHRNHPSVIVWSVGNENRYDPNFKLSYDYVKSADKSRPVIFSYPGMVPDSIQCYDILSMHYPSYTGNMGPQYGIKIANFEYQTMPVLFDEWAHVACYNLPTLRTDPNVREFWGQSLDSMWTNLFESKGGLGGAIWGFIDETFMMPETLGGFNNWWGIQEIKGGSEVYRGPTIGYGEWGIVDTWRRKKPEFWNTKKAYSPAKILIKEIEDFQDGKDILLPVYNRFDFTNFNELTIEWEYQSVSGMLVPPDLEPHQKGTLKIPHNNWKKGEYLTIRFYQNGSDLIDQYHLRFGSRELELPELIPGMLNQQQDHDYIFFSGKNYSAKLSLKTGLMEDLSVRKDTLIKSGPYLNLLAFDKGSGTTIPFFDKARVWKLVNLEYSQINGIITINTDGTFDDTIAVHYTLQLDETGTLKISYSAAGLPEGKFIRECGIKFIGGNQFTKMKWDRHSYWSAYPEFHLGMPQGEIELNNPPAMVYREYPTHLWENDIKDFYYQGIHPSLPLSKIARATKENIYSFALTKNDLSGLIVLAAGDKSCRLDRTESGYILFINDLWDYASLKWGNYQKNITFEKEFKGTVYLQIRSF
jgi:beta-galactosidase